MFILSRIIGLRVTLPGGPSESLDRRHLGQYSCAPKVTKLGVRFAQFFVLALTTNQCVGTLIRTFSRLFIGYRLALLAGDFEALLLSIGAVAVLIKSWLGFLVNVEWTSDDESRPRSLDMSMRTQRQRSAGIFTDQDGVLAPSEIISEIFLEFQARALVLLGLYLICWIILGILSGRMQVCQFFCYCLLLTFY